MAEIKDVTIQRYGAKTGDHSMGFTDRERFTLPAAHVNSLEEAALLVGTMTNIHHPDSSKAMNYQEQPNGSISIQFNKAVLKQAQPFGGIVVHGPDGRSLAGLVREERTVLPYEKHPMEKWAWLFVLTLPISGPLFTIKETFFSSKEYIPPSRGVRSCWTRDQYRKHFGERAETVAPIIEQFAGYNIVTGENDLGYLGYPTTWTKYPNESYGPYHG